MRSQFSALSGYVGQYWIVISGLLPKGLEQFLQLTVCIAKGYKRCQLFYIFVIFCFVRLKFEIFKYLYSSSKRPFSAKGNEWLSKLNNYQNCLAFLPYHESLITGPREIMERWSTSCTIIFNLDQSNEIFDKPLTF